MSPLGGTYLFIYLFWTLVFSDYFSVLLELLLNVCYIQKRNSVMETSEVFIFVFTEIFFLCLLSSYY